MFDHGNSLFNYAGSDDLTSEQTLSAYADTLLPCVYDDFLGTARKALSPALREGLRRLVEFNFQLHAIRAGTKCPGLVIKVFYYTTASMIVLFSI